MASSIGFRMFSCLPSCYSSYGAWTLTPVGLAPTDHASLRWTHTSGYLSVFAEPFDDLHHPQLFTQSVPDFPSPRRESQEDRTDFPLIAPAPDDCRIPPSTQGILADWRSTQTASYSPRKTCTGSTEAARRAGKRDATRVKAKTATAVRIMTTGSNGLTLKSKDRKTLDAVAAPASPRTQPRAASLRPEMRTSRRICKRCAPRAMRMAISCTRDVTEKAIML